MVQARMISVALAGVVGSIVVPSVAQTICARVGVQLTQEAVISRNAFRATLTINNEAGEHLTDIGVVLDIRDPDNVDGTLRFDGINSPMVSGGLTAVDGTGILPSGASGSAQWILTPRDEAAPSGPLVYGFGGTLTYTTAEGTLNIPLQPVYLTVLPNPRLTIKYFWERDVYADDPLTTGEVEPQRPFSVGVLLSSIGAGVAHNVRFSSAQPLITRNDRGLVIDFQLIGTEVGCNPISPALTFNFGDFQPGDSRVARWLMTSTLSGHFENYSVSMEHIDALGDPRVSLFENPTIHELIHAVRVVEGGADCALDFLASDLTPSTDPPDPFEDPSDPERLHLPDRLHSSDGQVHSVIPILTADVQTLPQLRATIAAEVPSDAWFYLRVPDPSDAAYQVVRVVRSDGRELEVGVNVWQTDRVFRDNDQKPLRLNRLHLFDKGGDGRYTVYYGDPSAPRIESWEVLAAHATLAETAQVIPASPRYSESRIGGLRKLRVRFSRAIKAETFTPASLEIAGTNLDNAPIPLSHITFTTRLSFDQRTGVIELSEPLPDRGVYCLRLVGVEDPFGNAFEVDSARVIATLAGDATGDWRVNNTDIGAVLPLVGTDPIVPSNVQHARADIDRDGRITQDDVELILAARRLDARFVSDPCGLSHQPPAGQPGDAPAGDAGDAEPWMIADVREFRDPAGGPPGVIPHTYINARGYRAGSLKRPDGMTRAALISPTGRVIDLGTLGGRFSVALGINDHNQVVGYSETAAGEVHAFRYTPATEDSAAQMEDLGTLGGSRSWASGINNLGESVGASTLGPGGVTHAFFSDGAVLIDLNDLLAPDAGWTLLEAKSIDDAWRILGVGLTSAGQRVFDVTLIRAADDAPGARCAADFNADGVITSSDFYAFLTAFITSDAMADINADGVIDSRDLVQYLERYFGGC